MSKPNSISPWVTRTANRRWWRSRKDFSPPRHKEHKAIYWLLGQCPNPPGLRDRLAMENDPRGRTKRVCSGDLVWFRGSFLVECAGHPKRNLDNTVIVLSVSCHR